MPELTVCIPIANYHETIFERAIASVEAQSISCHVLLLHDAEARGSGWARNRLLEQVTTPFVTFLDADDQIEPDFADICLKIWGVVTGEHYIYTNWYGAGDRIIQAPAPSDLWRGAGDTQERGLNFHPVTTFLPTSSARKVGGFDELLPGGEDSDFYIRLRIARVCAVHCNEDLFRWGREGQRSLAFAASGQEWEFRPQIAAKYGRYDMGCCDNANKVNPLTPEGEPAPGDVLAQALWHGNDRKLGLATGRLYPRTGHPKPAYVAPADIAAAPHQWRKVTHPQDAQGSVILPHYQAQPIQQPASNPQWHAGAERAFGGGTQTPIVSSEAANHYKPMVNERSRRDVIAAAKGKLG